MAHQSNLAFSNGRTKSMRIFISGIAGFLGSYLAEEFQKLGHEVFGCDNLSGGYVENVPNGVKWHVVDLCDFSALLKLTEGMDIIYHCAATAYEGLSVFSPYFVTNNIVGASVSLMTAAIQNKVKRFIYCSSMARYGNNKVPFTEDMIPCPVDPYGIGKVAGENYLKNLAQTHGMEYVIAVPHNIIGPRQKYDDPYRNVASIMINLMLQNRQPVIYGDGNQKRCFSFISDDVEILTKFALEPGISGEVFNIGPDEEFVTINQLAETIAELLDFPLKPIYVPERPQEVRLANCSADKIRKRFGYNPQYSLHEGIKEMIQYIKLHGVKKFLYHINLEILNERTPETWQKQIF